MKHMGHAIPGFLLFTIVAAFPNVTYAQGVQWQTDSSHALQQASTTERLVLMKFTADWCGHCKRMERITFSDPATAEVVQRNFVPLLIDIEKHGDIAKQFRIKGLPCLLIVTPDMTILERITGYHTSKKLIPKLNSVVIAKRPPARTPVLPVAQQQTQMPVANLNVSAGNTTRKATRRPSFNGQCLISVIDQRKLVPGSSDFTEEYRGQTLYFHNAAQRDRFLRTPDAYWPQLDGMCAMTFLKTGRQVPGQLKFAVVFREQIWVLQQRSQLRAFIESPADHVTLVEKRLKQSKTADRSY